MSEVRKKNKKKWKKVVRKIFLILLAAILLAAGGYYGYHRLKAEYTVVYDTYTAQKGTISNSLSFSGSLSLIDSATYYPNGSADVRTVYVSEGDQVKEGEKLVRLSNGESFTADFDGRVNKVNVDPGDSVDMNTALVQIADFTHMRVSIRVDEYDISDVSVGAACRVTATATEQTFESTISSIDYISASGGNVAYYTALVYVDLNGDEGVYPGMQVTVTVPQEEATDVVILKLDAVSFDEKNSAFVWKKDEAGELVRADVEVGVSNGNYVEIRSGVEENETVYAESKEKNAAAELFASMFRTNQFSNNRGGMPGGGMGGYGGMGGWNGGGSNSRTGTGGSGTRTGNNGSNNRTGGGGR